MVKVTTDGSAIVDINNDTMEEKEVVKHDHMVTTPLKYWLHVHGSTKTLGGLYDELVSEARSVTFVPLSMISLDCPYLSKSLDGKFFII